MKRLIGFFAVLAAVAITVGCEILPKTVVISVQLKSDGAPLAAEGVNVNIADAAGTVNFDMATDASGVATFVVLPGSYTATATIKTVEAGKRVVYNGSNTNILVSEKQEDTAYDIDLQKVESQQLVIKELYCTGCPKNEGTGSYSNDAYIIVYNNSEFEADASDLVFGNLNPYNGHATNKYYGTDNKLVYESDNWVPAGGAVWYFKNPVKIPAYSQIVIAVFGAIDHTATVNASVDLSKADYYWMSNSEIPAYTNKKYAVAETIPASHYLSGIAINMGNAWVLSNSAPALYMGKMPKAQLEQLCNDTEKFDQTAGTGNVNWTVKFPKANVIGALEVFSAANIEKSLARFSPDINTGYVAITNNKGYTVYRNVDKEATEALPENEGKLVYGYSGGTEDVNGSTDPSGIDAEASIANGAHIIYAQTNDSGKDFHQRKVSSLK